MRPAAAAWLAACFVAAGASAEDAEFAAGGGWAARPIVLRGDRDAAARLDAARAAAEAGRAADAAALLNAVARDFGESVVGGPYRLTGVDAAVEGLAAEYGLTLDPPRERAAGREAVAAALRSPESGPAQAAGLAAAAAWLDAGEFGTAADAAAALRAAFGDLEDAAAAGRLAAAARAAAGRSSPPDAANFAGDWPGGASIEELREAIGPPYFDPHAAVSWGGGVWAVRFVDRLVVYGGDGSERWSRPLSPPGDLAGEARRVLTESVFGPPAVAAGRVWVVDESADGGTELRGFGLSDGSPTTGAVRGAVGTPVAAGASLFVPLVRDGAVGVAEVNAGGEEVRVIPLGELPAAESDRWQTRQACAAAADARRAYFAFNDGLLAAVDVWTGRLAWAAVVPVATTDPATQTEAPPAAAVPRETFCPPALLLGDGSLVAAAPDWLGPVVVGRDGGGRAGALRPATTAAAPLRLRVDGKSIVAALPDGSTVNLADVHEDDDAAVLGLGDRAFGTRGRKYRITPEGIRRVDGPPTADATEAEAPFASLPLPDDGDGDLPAARWPPFRAAVEVRQPSFVPSEAYVPVEVRDAATGRPSDAVGVLIESQRRRSALIRVGGAALPVLTLPPFRTTERLPEELDLGWVRGRRLLLRLGLQLFRVDLPADAADPPRLVGEPVDLLPPLTPLRRRAALSVTRTPFGPLATTPQGEAYGDVAVLGDRVLHGRFGPGRWGRPPLALSGVFAAGATSARLVGGRRPVVFDGDGVAFGGVSRRPTGRLLSATPETAVSYDEKAKTLYRTDLRTGMEAPIADVAESGHISVVGGEVVVWDAAAGSLRRVDADGDAAWLVPVDVGGLDVRRVFGLPRPGGTVFAVSGDVTDAGLADAPQRGGAESKPLVAGRLLKVAGGRAAWSVELPPMALSRAHASDVPALFFEWLEKATRPDGRLSGVPSTRVLAIDDRTGGTLLSAAAASPVRSRLRVDRTRRRLTVDLGRRRFAIPFGAD